MINYPRCIMAAILWTGAQTALHAAPRGAAISNPDFTQGDKIPQGATHDWNLGPTGARGWIYSNKLETSDARQIAITKVDKGSPADGKLKPGDVILGVNKQPFSYDPRTELGKAIGMVEASDGVLTLSRWRAGKVSNISIKLPVLGKYAPTAPFDCAKSKLIFEQGCKALAERMKANPKEGNHITRSLNALALLSSGNPEYLPLIKEQVARAAKYEDRAGRSLHAWFYGPVNLLLAEYTLATGDRTFLPDMKRITMEIVRGQSVIGSWGHRFVRENGRLGGYGMMHAPGIPLTTSLILARAAGVKDPALDLAIEKSRRVIRFYVGTGSVPYGDHQPWIQTHGDNGKNGMAAVMFNLLGDSEAATYFSRMSTASHGSERDTGHTGNFFNMLWAMPSVALSGPNATGAWLKEFGWYYDLTRRWDGTYRHQGPPAAKPDKYKNWDSTGTYLLAYAQPLRKIYLTGKREGLVKQVSPEIALGLIADGRGWSSKNKNKVYSDRSVEALFTGLTNWSPVVRERAAMALASRKGISVNRLTKMLGGSDLYSQIGACQALAKLKGKAAQAVPALRKALQAKDLWLRIKAAEALAAIGKPAFPAVPELLAMLHSEDLKNDPRGMQQRYLCFALFDRSGLLQKGSLEGIDREEIHAAVRTGLKNEDGRARGAVGSIFKKLKFKEIEPLLPAIHQAVVEPAPSGIMFASGVRLSGLEILAQHHIKEGMPLCLDVMGIDRWGKKGRISKCLKILKTYQGAAKPLLPQLQELEKQLTAHREAKGLQGEIKLLRETIAQIKTATKIPELKSINR